MYLKYAPNRFLEGLIERSTVFDHPRKVASFFQEFDEHEIARNDEELKQIRHIIQILQQNLTCTSQPYKGTGSKTHWQKGQKQRKAAVRYIINNLIVAARAFGTVKIPMDQNYWAKRAKENKTFLSPQSFRDVMKELEQKNIIECIAKHHEQSEHCRCWYPTDKFVFNVSIQAPNLCLPYISNNKQLKKKKNQREKHKGWENIHLNIKKIEEKQVTVTSKKTGKTRIKTIKTKKKDRFYYHPGNYNIVFTEKEQEIIISNWILNQYAKNQQTEDKTLIVRIRKEDWYKLTPTKRDYMRTLIYSGYLIPTNTQYKEINIRLYPYKSYKEYKERKGGCCSATAPHSLFLSEQTNIGNSKVKEKNRKKEEKYPKKEKKVKNKESERKKTITHKETQDKEYFVDIHSQMPVFDWDTWELRKEYFDGMQEPEYFEYALPPSEMFRVFIDDQNHGGRYYGSMVQRLPKEIRHGIMIQNADGTEEPLVELDYSQLHPTILYCEKGLTPPEHPYGNVTCTDREERKVALLVMINAEDKESAIGAMRQHFRDGMGYTKGSKKLKSDYIESLFDEVAKINKDIAESFFTGEGSRLQGIDSTIATKVIYDFMQKYPSEPIECLHDSFMVPEKRKHFLKRKMVEHFQAVVGTTFTPQITVD